MMPPNVGRRQDGCTSCGAYCCASNEVCHKDTYYYISMCSATATVTVTSGDYSPGARIPITRTFVQTTTGSTITSAYTLVGQVLDDGQTNWVGYDFGRADYLLTSSAANAQQTTLSDGNIYYVSDGNAPSGHLDTGTPYATSSTAARTTGGSSTSPSSRLSSRTSTSMTTTPTPTSQSSGLSTSAQGAIGGTVVGVSAAILAVILFICCRRRRRRRRRQTGQGPLSSAPQQDGELEDMSSGSGFAQMRERRLSEGELARRRQEAEEERKPAEYPREGPNPWTLSGSDVTARRQRERAAMIHEDDDMNDPRVGSPFSPEAVGNHHHVAQPSARDVRGNIHPVPPPPQYYRG